ncbi:hypothetical protein BU16DRAFT_314982 [Lophium mytilinum]|uniref:Ribosomal protein/NADH dehydrogenase domain-containing protein n=1 Tax=Lophium mytilinum TaxID=390894 RepID=A0A6A6R0J1_9PEZI|nr:hypothetical protein BU16DRAFT_314982 [Lophium mytilinum]
MTNKTLRMVSILQRMRKLKTKLLAIRIGPGAVILPKDVKKINLEFAKHIEGGHRGARKFWRDILPRLKYRNPAIPMTVSRHETPTGPSVLTVTFTTPTPAAGSSTDATPVKLEARPPLKIDMRNRVESEILNELVKATGGTEVAPTEVELEEKRELEEEAEKSSRDRERSLVVRRERKREEEMLKAARGVA